jgi:ribosomal-protein-alanine N-acetyltransferase
MPDPLREPARKRPTVDQQFVLREYRAADFHRLWEIDQLCFEPGIAYTQMDLTGFLAQRNAIALVAECGELHPDTMQAGQIAGFVVAHARHKVGRVVTIDVLPAARGLGLGSQLMSECETRLRAAGCTQIVLETAVNNAAALRLYEKLGYKILRTLPEYYSSESLDAFLMGKQLV